MSVSTVDVQKVGHLCSNFYTAVN